jgi:hypothetical protein
MNVYDSANETSEGPHLGVVMPPSEQSATAETQFRTIFRHHVLDECSDNVDEVCLTLEQRASKSGSAK